MLNEICRGLPQSLYINTLTIESFDGTEPELLTASLNKQQNIRSSIALLTQTTMIRLSTPCKAVSRLLFYTSRFA